MRERSLGITALAFSSVMVALYCQFAAIAVILTGSVFSPTGSGYAAMAIANGALFLGLTFASYFLGYGFWTRKHWSWAGGLALFTALVAANLLLSYLSTNFVSSLLPTTAAVVGIWYLQRASVRAELLGSDSRAESRVGVPEGLEAAGIVR